MRLLFAIVVGAAISACATSPFSALPGTFTTENIMKIHPGMSSDDIIDMFGYPKNVSQAVCGGEDAWVCTTWEYGKYPYDRARFTFSGADPRALVLNNFEIERD